MARLLLATCAALFAACAGMDPQAGLAARVDAIVKPLVDAHQFSGAIVLSRAGTTAYQRGFGLANRAAGLAFTPDTPADGGSLAKTFTAAAVWTLVDAGRVQLDAPVTRYVPGFPHPQTSVAQLLSHSNGLPPDYEFFDPHFSKDEVRTTQALLRVVARQSPAPTFPPGSRFEYSNLGFDVAALLIESVTGLSYDAYLKERFFSPLGMSQTFARPPRLADWAGVRTLGYRWHDATWKLFDVFDNEAFLGASNLYFSASDLARWASAHAAGTALPGAVHAAGQRRMLIDGKPSAITGLSWYCDDAGLRCYYTGSLNAFHSLVYWDRGRNESLVLVSNSTTPPWQVISLQRDLADALAGRPARADPAVPFTRLKPETPSAAAGVYLSEGVGVVSVEANAKGMSVRIGCGLKYDMYPVGPEVFYVPGTDHWMAFSGGALPTTLHIRSMFVDARLGRSGAQARAEACP